MREFFNEYGATAIGLVIGSVAHFGRLIQEGRVLTLAQTIGYFMQLGIVGLISVVSTND